MAFAVAAVAERSLTRRSVPRKPRRSVIAGRLCRSVDASLAARTRARGGCAPRSINSIEPNSVLRLCHVILRGFLLSTGSRHEGGIDARVRTAVLTPVRRYRLGGQNEFGSNIYERRMTDPKSMLPYNLSQVAKLPSSSFKKIRASPRSARLRRPTGGERGREAAKQQKFPLLAGL